MSMENLVQRVQRELELSRAKGGAIQGLPQNFGGARAPGFRPVAATHAQEGALPDEFGSYVVLSSQKIEAARRHHDATAVPAGPSSSVVHVPGKTSARTFPCQATMQWDYVGTREDELTAKAGETIVIAGEYKNAGWLWAYKMQPAGQPPPQYKLIPANYFSSPQSG
ncbi:hypothetical protein T484DRAFT_1800251 [Baffinella frigidus]|nr:hypothetical protein T484DRAFT_1800251 [Cryptophyta sp. CCMP2293]